MFSFFRRPEPQRRLLGEFGISEAEYDRIVARIRAERSQTKGDARPASIASVARSQIRGPRTMPQHV